MEPRFSCVLLSDGTHKSLRCLHHVLGVDVFYMSLGVILTCMTFLYMKICMMELTDSICSWFSAMICMIIKMEATDLFL